MMIRAVQVRVEKSGEGVKMLLANTGNVCI
jgi:hypothetical protein